MFSALALWLILENHSAGASEARVNVHPDRKVELSLDDSARSLVLSERFDGFVPVNLGESRVDLLQVAIMTRSRALTYVITSDRGPFFTVEGDQIVFARKVRDQIASRLASMKVDYNDVAMAIKVRTPRGFLTEVELRSSVRDQLTGRSLCQRWLTDPIARWRRGRVTWR